MARQSDFHGETCRVCAEVCDRCADSCEQIGARFEIAFMRSMIRHHRTAIREGDRCLDRAYHDELRSLCQQIITAQSAEIAQMQQWLCDWYDRCTARRDDAA